MTATDILAKNTAEAHQRALGIVEEYASGERAEKVRKHASQAHARSPQELAEFQAQMLSALAEMVEDLYSKQASSSKSKKAS